MSVHPVLKSVVWSVEKLIQGIGKDADVAKGQNKLKKWQ
jgi:hypothetical protein